MHAADHNNLKPSGSRPRPEFHQLAVFLKVVEARSFTAAARRIGCSQPAISQAIARLEETYGGDLFERRRGAVLALTPIGEAILPSARALLRTVDEQMECAFAAARGRVGSVTLGFHAGLAGRRLGIGLTDFRAAHPKVRIEMVETAPIELRRQLSDQRIDLVISVQSDDACESALARERLWDEPLYAASPVDHPWATQSELDWSVVTAEPLLLPAGSGELIAAVALSNRGMNQRLEAELHNVSRDGLLEMVGIGVGCSLILGTPAAPHCGVAFRPVAGIGTGIAFEAIWRERDGNPLRHRLLQHIRRAARSAQDLGALSGPAASTPPSLGLG